VIENRITFTKHDATQMYVQAAPTCWQLPRVEKTTEHQIGAVVDDQMQMQWMAPMDQQTFDKCRRSRRRVETGAHNAHMDRLQAYCQCLAIGKE
jgi:hypothetical protein